MTFRFLSAYVYACFLLASTSLICSLVTINSNDSFKYAFFTNEFIMTFNIVLSGPSIFQQHEVVFKIWYFFFGYYTQNSKNEMPKVRTMFFT